jgi:hypothetical protein
MIKYFSWLKILGDFYYLFLCFCSIGDWIQSLKHASQVLYYCAMSPAWKISFNTCIEQFKGLISSQCLILMAIITKKKHDPKGRSTMAVLIKCDIYFSTIQL